MYGYIRSISQLQWSVRMLIAVVANLCGIGFAAWRGLKVPLGYTKRFWIDIVLLALLSVGLGLFLAKLFPLHH